MDQIDLGHATTATHSHRRLMISGC